MLPGLEAALPRVGTPSGASQLGNKMAHARERAFPVLSSSCFRNKQADPAQTPLSSTDGRLGNTVSSRLQIAPKPGITCYMQTLLPLAWSLLGVGTSGLACHQVQREVRSVP